LHAIPLQIVAAEFAAVRWGRSVTYTLQALTDTDMPDFTMFDFKVTDGVAGARRSTGPTKMNTFTPGRHAR